MSTPKISPGSTPRKKMRRPQFPQTPFHKTVYSWLKRFKSDGDLWDMLTALRSCDQPDSTSKSHTAGRVRAVVGLSDGDFCQTGSFYPSSTTFPLSKEGQRIRDMRLALDPTHYREHYWAAVDAIRRATGYNLKTETKVPRKAVASLTNKKVRGHKT